jgi:hypothetical protein
VADLLNPMLAPIYHPNGSGLNSFQELLRKISYKPGWKIELHTSSLYDNFDVVCLYEGYESENAYFDPICLEDSQVSRARQVLGRSIGKSVRNRNRFCYRRSFNKYELEIMTPENIVRYFIVETIKQAEAYEFERWFKFDGVKTSDSSERREDYRPLQNQQWVR